MNELKLYTAKIAVHENKQWRAYKVKVMAKNSGDALNIIANKYGNVQFTLQRMACRWSIVRHVTVT